MGSVAWEQEIMQEEKRCRLPFLRRLLRRLLLSPSSWSASASLLTESDELSQLSCRFSVVAAKLDARISVVSFAEEAGLSKRFGSGVKLLDSPLIDRFTLVNPEFTAVNPPELIAVKPDVGA